MSREGPCSNPGRHYREHPEEWAETGIMNSRGELVCLDAPKEVCEMFRESQPLMASLSFTHTTPED